MRARQHLCRVRTSAGTAIAADSGITLPVPAQMAAAPTEIRVSAGGGSTEVNVFRLMQRAMHDASGGLSRVHGAPIPNRRNILALAATAKPTTSPLSCATAGLQPEWARWLGCPARRHAVAGGCRATVPKPAPHDGDSAIAAPGRDAANMLRFPFLAHAIGHRSRYA
jgi:hypothetical protein